MSTLDFDVVARDHASAALLKVARSMQASESAADKVSSALRKQADAAGQVRVAQTRLEELQKKGRASASQLAAAEERVAKAQRGAEAANRTLGRAQKALATSQQQVITKTDVETGALHRQQAAMRQSTQSTGRLRGAFSRLGPTIGVAVSSGVASLALLGGAAGAVGIKTAAGMEQAKIAFTTMLGSGRAADRFIKQLAKFAAETPFDFPGLQQAASSLISAGIDAKKVIPIMTTLGDVTSGMGTGAEGIQRATVALQQMNAAGKITGEDLNQLRDAGIPVYDLLAKATGKSKAEVVKLAQAGKLGKDSLDKMMKALESGKGLERFSGLMQKQSQSLAGLWSTLKDNIGQGLARAITPAIPAIKRGLAIAGDAAQKAFTKIAAFGKGMSGVISILAKGDFAGAAKTFGFEEDSSQVAFLFKLRDAFVTVGKAVKSATIFGEGYRSFLVDKLWPALQKAYQTIMPGVREAMAVIGKAFGGAGTKSQTFSSVVSRIGEVITTKVIPAIATFTRYYLPFIATQIAVVIGALRLGWSAFVHLNLVVTRVGADVIRTVLSMFGTIIHGAAAAFGWLDPTGKLKAAAAAFDRFEAQARSALQGIENGAFDLAHGSQKYGEQWAAGLAAGIRKNASVPVAEAQGVANKVTAMMRSAKGFDTHSPSKKAARIGRDVSAGLGVGIQAGTAKAVAAAKKLADSVMGRVDTAIDRARSRLTDLRSAFADIQSSVADAVRGGLDLSQFTNPTSLAGGFAAFAAKVKSFAWAIRRMISERYPTSLVQQVAAMGVDGLDTARAFADADLAQRRQIVRDYATSASVANSLGGTVARSTNLDEGIRLQQGQIRRLERIGDELRLLRHQAAKGTDLTQSSIERLARELSRRPTVAQISQGALNNALVAGMR